MGHSHYIEDVVISSDGQFALSASWDSTLRLWDLNTGVTTKRFIGHKKDILSVAFSADNRQIVSGSRDKTIKLWNTLGECKWTIEDQGHSEWVSCVRFSPNTQNPVVVRCAYACVHEDCCCLTVSCLQRWLGWRREGVESVQLQAAHQPGGPQGLRQHRHHQPRRLAVRQWWPRRHGHAVGLDRGASMHGCVCASVWDSFLHGC